jgi:hypothetical protein
MDGATVFIICLIGSMVASVIVITAIYWPTKRGR